MSITLQDNPVFSIITVNYNNAQGLNHTLNSILNQEYKNFELIVIDANSNDNSKQIIQNYQNIITHKISENDEGIYDGMNKGVKLSQGKWLYFLNSGDIFYSKNTLKQLFKIINTVQDNYALIYGGVIFENQKTPQNQLLKPVNFDCLWQGMAIPHQALFAKRELLKNTPFEINKKLVISADFDFVYKMYLNKQKFYFINQIISIIESNGLSSQRFKTLFGNYFVYCKNGSFSLYKHLYYFGKIIIYLLFKNKLMLKPIKYLKRISKNENKS